MPAKSKSQQRLFGMALAVRRGELKRSDVNDSVIDIVDSDMTDKEIEDFASSSPNDTFFIHFITKVSFVQVKFALCSIQYQNTVV